MKASAKKVEASSKTSNKSLSKVPNKPKKAAGAIHIPDKLFFKIGEVADLIGVKPYVLRYWETEFNDIHPTKSNKGQRLYKRKDVELIAKIRDLLYREKYTIDGARKRLVEKIKRDIVVDAGQMNLDLPRNESTDLLLGKLRDTLKDILKEVAEPAN